MIEDGLAVEFNVTDDNCPLAAATAATGTSIECTPPPQLRTDGNVLLRQTLKTDGKALAEELDEDGRISHVFLTANDNHATIRCLSADPCVLHTLTNAGFLPEEVQYSNGEGRFSGAVIGREILENVLRAAGKAVGVRVLNIYQIDEDHASSAGRWNLTPPQHEALRVGHEMGYFRAPREASAEDVAAELDIGKSAYLQRIRRAQRSLVAQIFSSTEE